MLKRIQQKRFASSTTTSVGGCCCGSVCATSRGAGRMSAGGNAAGYSLRGGSGPK